MFPLKRYDSVSKQTAIISETQATKLLENRRPDFKKENNLYSEKQFEYLVGQPIQVTINNQNITFVIQDIFYDNTYYGTGLDHTVGSFFYTSYYFPKGVKRQNLYFMCRYSYENSYFMKYINNVYGEGEYTIKCVTNTFEKEIDHARVLSFYTRNFSSRKAIQIICLALACSTFGLSIYLIFKNRHSLNLSFTIANLGFSLLPYLFFLTLYKITGEILFFSGVGCKLNALFLLINFSVCLVMFAIFNLDILGLKNKRKNYYETNI